MSLFNKMDPKREEAKRKQEKLAKEANEAMGLTAHGEYRSSSNKASPSASSVSAPAKKWATVQTSKKVGLGRRKSRKTTRKSKKTRRN